MTIMQFGGESVTGLAIMLQIRKIVVRINAVVLEESMDLHPGVVAQQTPQLTDGELAFTISFEGNGFQSGAERSWPEAVR